MTTIEMSLDDLTEIAATVRQEQSSVVWMTKDTDGDRVTLRVLGGNHHRRRRKAEPVYARPEPPDAKE